MGDRGALKSLQCDDPVLVVSDGARLIEIKGELLLFLPGSQAIFRVSRITSHIWPWLTCGVHLSQLRKVASLSYDVLEATLEDLLAARAIVPVGLKDRIVNVSSRYAIDIAAQHVCFNFTGSRGRDLVQGMFGHLEAPLSPAGQQFIIIGDDESGMAVARMGKKPTWSPWDQAAPSLKLALTNYLLSRFHGVLLHVATLFKDDSALLLVGEPGAGKSTLSVALGETDFRLEGDDIAELLPNGQARGLPFPATVKDGAWQLLAQFRPDLYAQPSFTRPDSQVVRYLGLNTHGGVEARTVRCVLRLSRRPDSEPGLQSLDVHEALAALLEGAWSREKKLKPNDFEALALCVVSAKFFRVTYTDLDSAIQLVNHAWNRSIDGSSEGQ